MSDECEVNWEDWHFKGVQWHHPISEHPEVGINLCQGHHSLICGRKKRYSGETCINETNDERKIKIFEFCVVKLQQKGFGRGDVDKN